MRLLSVRLRPTSARDSSPVAHKGLGPRRPLQRVALEFMDPDSMTTAGILVWAGIVTVGTLVGSYFVALGWQRWKDKKGAT
jgi:hypothetical protein